MTPMNMSPEMAIRYRQLAARGQLSPEVASRLPAGILNDPRIGAGGGRGFINPPNKYMPPERSGAGILNAVSRDAGGGRGFVNPPMAGAPKQPSAPQATGGQMLMAEEPPVDYSLPITGTDEPNMGMQMPSPMSQAMGQVGGGILSGRKDQGAIYDGMIQAGAGLLANTANPSKALAAGFGGFSEGYDASKKANQDKITAIGNGRAIIVQKPDGSYEIKPVDAVNNPYGKAPTGYRFTAEGNLEVIPNGPADIKAQAILRAEQTATTNAIASADNVMSTVDEITASIESGKTGFGVNTTTGLTGSLIGMVPGTKAYDVREAAKTISANLGFDRLQQMRKESTTGGALGQVAVQELEALQKTIASVNPNQSDDKVLENLQKVRDQYTRWKSAYQASRSEIGGAPSAAPAPAAATGASGVPQQFQSFIPK